MSHQVDRTYKTVKQQFTPTIELYDMMETFRQMVNECIQIGLDSNISTLGKFSSNHYHKLKKHESSSIEITETAVLKILKITEFLIILV